MVRREHHLPRASGFQEYDYTSVVVNNQVDNYFSFNRETEDLVIGQNKQLLTDAVHLVHITTDQMYTVSKSNPKQFINKCVDSTCPWRMGAA